jgi:hypothetical protein
MLFVYNTLNFFIKRDRKDLPVHAGFFFRVPWSKIDLGKREHFGGRRQSLRHGRVQFENPLNTAGARLLQN